MVKCCLFFVNLSDQQIHVRFTLDINSIYFFMKRLIKCDTQID